MEWIFINSQMIGCAMFFKTIYPSGPKFLLVFYGVGQLWRICSFMVIMSSNVNFTLSYICLRFFSPLIWYFQRIIHKWRQRLAFFGPISFVTFLHTKDAPESTCFWTFSFSLTAPEYQLIRFRMKMDKSQYLGMLSNLKIICR